MQHLTLNEFRAAHEVGGFKAAKLVGHGDKFYIAADALTGDQAILVLDAGRKPRYFSVGTGLKLLRDIGFADAAVDLRHWSPGQAALKTEKGARAAL